LLIVREEPAVEAAGAVVSYEGFRFPAEVIAHAVCLYHRFPLSFREVEELLLARGVIVSHEAIRRWCEKFGSQYAAALRRRAPRPSAQVDNAVMPTRLPTPRGQCAGAVFLISGWWPGLH
jgi:transposase-like protein